MPLPVTSILELHADRRRAGVPTISVLRGPLPLSIAEFRRWAKGAKLEPCLLLVDDDRELVAAWAEALGSHPTVRARAIEVIARAAETSRESVRALADSRSIDARLLFERAAAGGSVAAFCCAVLGRVDATAVDPVAMAGTLLGTAGPQPALLVLARHHSAAMAAQVERLVRAVEGAPSLVVALAIEAEAFTRLTAPPPTRSTAMLDEGVLDVRPPPVLGDDLERHPATAAAGLARRQLAAQGMPATVLHAHDEVAALPTSTAPDRARSAYERLLFEVLEHDPETAGAFELNATLGFLHGPRPAEVDLVSRRLGIAVEIDGFFHFAGGDEAFRRDRRKDVLLQRHGYLVSRWLAQDVCERLHMVMNGIREIVRWRRHDKGEPRP